MKTYYYLINIFEINYLIIIAKLIQKSAFRFSEDKLEL